MNTTLLPSTHRRAKSAGLIALALGAWALAACATTPAPTSELAVSTAAVAHAAGAGAPQLAPAEMQTARDKLGRATAAMDAKDYDNALKLAQQAEVDAQFAEARAEAMKARKAADAMQESNRVLREEMNRKPPQ